MEKLVKVKNKLYWKALSIFFSKNIYEVTNAWYCNYIYAEKNERAQRFNKWLNERCKYKVYYNGKNNDNETINLIFSSLNDVLLFKLEFYDPEDVEYSLSTLNKVILPIIRRVMPKVIANEIIGVQPMSGPVSQIFTMQTKYKLNEELDTALNMPLPQVKQDISDEKIAELVSLDKETNPQAKWYKMKKLLSDDLKGNKKKTLEDLLEKTRQDILNMNHKKGK